MSRISNRSGDDRCGELVGLPSDLQPHFRDGQLESIPVIDRHSAQRSPT